MDLQTHSFKYPGFYRALVLDNADPSQLGRIKARVFGIFHEDIPSAKLPWAVPAMSVFSGAGTGFGNFAVPEINSYVFVFFEGQDIYQPVYFAEAQDGVHGLPTERVTNYPYRKVIKTKNGIVIIVDDSAKEIHVNHPSGSYLKIDTNGNIEVTGEDITVSGNNVEITGTIAVNINPS